MKSFVTGALILLTGGEVLRSQDCSADPGPLLDIVSDPPLTPPPNGGKGVAWGDVIADGFPDFAVMHARIVRQASQLRSASFNSRCNQARARDQSVSTVVVERPSASAVSCRVRPPK